MDFHLTKVLASLLAKGTDIKTVRTPAVEMSLKSLFCALSWEISSPPYADTWEAGMLTAKELCDKKVNEKDRKRLHVAKQAKAVWAPSQTSTGNLKEDIQRWHFSCPLLCRKSPGYSQQRQWQGWWTRFQRPFWQPSNFTYSDWAENYQATH